MASLLIFLSSCISTERFNARIHDKITVKDLRYDIDFVQHKLERWHPSLDWYTPKESIDYRFSHLKEELKEPLTSREFYFRLAPIISQLRHGHTYISPLSERMEKSRERKIKNSKGPFSQLGWLWQDSSLYLTVNQTGDKTLPLGARILAINGVDPQLVYNKYFPAEHGDGYNASHAKNRINRSFGTYFSLEYGVSDSLMLVLLSKSDTLHKVVKRKWDKPKERVFKKITTDTVKQITNNLPKTSAKTKLPILELGLNSKTKKYTKILSFPSNDSAIALLKISSFSAGKHARDYRKIFKMLRDYRTKSLILDVRDNGGGFIRDASLLYAYLGEDPQLFIKGAETTSKASVGQAILKSVPSYTYPVTWVAAAFTFFRTTKGTAEAYNYPIYIPKKAHTKTLVFEGDIYMIINGGSYSATSLLAGNLKSTARAILVGEETGGDYNGTVAGIMPRYKLPYSQMKLQLGVMKVESAHQILSVGQSVAPDYPITQTLDDVLQKKDTSRDFVFQLIKKKKLTIQ